MSILADCVTFSQSAGMLFFCHIFARRVSLNLVSYILNSRHQLHLNRIGRRLNHIERLDKFIERELMRHNLAYID
jgi:hypothetical protein